MAPLKTPSSDRRESSFGDRCMCLQLRRAARLVTQMYDDEVQQTGLGMAQFAILGGLTRMGDSTQTELAARLRLDPTTLNRTVAPLIAKGLVAKRRRAEDRRGLVLHITAGGTARLNAASLRWRRAQDRVKAALGDKGWSGLHALLGNLLAELPPG
jgi:DNA-binding MarR family transcriptional regulator